MQALCLLLEEKACRGERPIYLISDEPYRELTIRSRGCISAAAKHKNTIALLFLQQITVAAGRAHRLYTYKPRIAAGQHLFQAVCGAGRALGLFVLRRFFSM